MKNQFDLNLRDLKTCYNYIRGGLLIILLAFFISAVNNLLDTPVRYLQMIVMPLTFVGMGTLLFGIGKHLHLLHLNIIRMMDMDTSESESNKDYH